MLGVLVVPGVLEVPVLVVLTVLEVPVLAVLAVLAVLMVAGVAGEAWLRRKMREIQKSAGYGRTAPPAAMGILLLEPRSAEKDRFRTHEGLVIRTWDAAADPLAPFVSRLRGDRSGEGPQG